VIAEMGVNFLERQVLRRGHQLRRVPQPEYGTDAQMLHFSPETSEIENGWVEFQVKATDNLRLVDQSKSVACTIETSHFHYWCWDIAHPFILVLYDARKNTAYWLDVQNHEPPGADLEVQESITVRIPTRNKLTVTAIDRFRKMSLERIHLS
jgi:uncharacterized protein DUF4365